MGKIKTLREDVYKKIAAGEVVERPLSVVKELVENSIDAGADTVKVEIIDGGKRLIKVVDNGSGFAPEDIEPAFKNHSTSKISELSDFDSLNTLGFRGEALPSILEVAKIEIKTSNTNDGKGIYCVFEEGKLIKNNEIACSRGTSIEVKDLFYNFPVRKKFLKTERTELNQIISFLEPAALVNYDKSFELIHNGKTVFTYQKAGSLNERIYQVFGKEFLDSLQEVNFEQGMNNYSLTGFISKLNTGLSVKKHQYFFVNRRPVRERTLIAALNNTFQKFLEKHRSPVGILLMEIPPEQVDVNIHPMKLEIKFKDSSAVYQFVKHAIESSFGVADEFSAGVDMKPGSSAPGPFTGNYQGRPAANVNPGTAYNRERTGTPQPYPDTKTRAQVPGGDYEQAQLFSGNFLDEDDFLIIGQYRNSYILVEKDKELLIVDQHNAQERVNFDHLKKEYREDKVTSIAPLFPIIIELSPSEVSSLDSRKMELLQKIGFRMEPLSGNSYDIKAFPQVLEEKSIKDSILTVIHINAKEGDISFEDEVLAEIACKSAIKINHKLYPDQMKTIVRNLFASTNPYFCPHKRPIIVEFPLEKIEKLLKRNPSARGA